MPDFGPGPGVQDDGELQLAPDHGRRSAARSGLEAALGVSRTDRLPDLHWLGDSLQGVRTDVAHLEAAAHQAARLLAHQHAARARQRLETRREVGGVAKGQSLLRAA